MSDMKPATLKALRASIRKWESIVDGTGADHGRDNCALCERFGEYCELADGERCPVYEATYRRDCADTPFCAWVDSIFKRDGYAATFRPYRATDDETVMCAVLEVEFLKSLLPEKETP